MLSFSNFTNTEAAVILLLKYSRINADTDKITSDLKKHPDYPSLLSVSDVLNSLKIENAAFQIDFDELTDIPCPFIAYSNLDGGSLLVVTKVTDKYFTFSNDKSNERRLTGEDFKRHYRGVVVVAEQSENHSPAVKGFSTFANQIKIPAITLGIVLIMLSALFYHTNYLNGLSWRLVFLTLFKTAGLITSILLLIQSFDSNNPLVQVVCQPKTIVMPSSHQRQLRHLALNG
jgi:ABC-type bacteriocin/lantibiotic exporter with double-glycine peptidase domain